MTTEEAHLERGRQEFERLNATWRKHFPIDKQTGEDLHAPIALRGIIHNVMRECWDNAFEHADSNRHKEGVDPYELMMTTFSWYAELVCTKFYRLGQLSGMKYEDMAECICKIVPDDELTEFLQVASGLRFLDNNVIPDHESEGGET